jgi:hypothetical protein
VNALNLSLRNTHLLSVCRSCESRKHAENNEEKKKKMEEMANQQKQSGGQGQAGEQEATGLTGTEPPKTMGEKDSVRE